MSGNVFFVAQPTGDQISNDYSESNGLVSGSVSFVAQPAGDQISTDYSESNGLKPGDLIHVHIKNNTQTEVLGATNDNKVILEVLKENRKEQLWKIGACDKDGYFTLENSIVPKFMTAISSSSLEIKGKITLSWITKAKTI